MLKNDIIKMEHGAGGELMEKLINEAILQKLDNCSAGGISLKDLDDGGSVPLKEEELVLTTDSHVVKPLFFPGGDIGKLAVSGTVNDLCVMGAEPLALTNSLVIGEGFDVEKIEEIIDSMNETSKKADVPIITGDTKVMEKNELNGVIINTAGVGIAKKPIRDKDLSEGDKLLINGPIGNHGLAIMSFREGFNFKSSLKSDVKPLNDLISSCLDIGGIKAMKDPTRGGLSNALNEMAKKSNMGVLIEEDKIPIEDEVKSAGEILGIDPLEVANEGKVVMSAEKGKAKELLNEMKKHDDRARIIGEVIGKEKGKVVLETEIGGKRFVEPPVGDPVPRVC